MKNQLALFLILGAVFFALSVATAQSENYSTVLSRLKELKNQGRYAEAIPVARVFLQLAKEKYGLEGEAIGLDWLGILYHEQGRYAEAEPLYQESLSIYEKALGPEHPDVALSLNNLAELYRQQGRYSEAELLFQLALAIAENSLGPEHPDVALSLNNMADL